MQAFFFALSLCFFLSTVSFAAQIRIEDPCGGEPWLEASLDEALGKSVGTLSLQALQNGGLDFVGTEAGLSSIAGIPAPEKTVEILTQGAMRAYGWCYQVDGFEPGVMPDAYRVTKPDASIVWFFGFAEYKQGQWVSMCRPTAEVRPVFVCGQGGT